MIYLSKEGCTLKDVDGDQFRAAMKAMGQMSVADWKRKGLTFVEAEKAQAFYLEASAAMEVSHVRA